MTFADVTQTTDTRPALGNPPAPVAGGSGGTGTGSTVTAPGKTGFSYVGIWSTHGSPPTTAVAGDIYIARDDANSGGLDASWNGVRGVMVKTGDLLLFTNPEWHVFAKR